VNRLIFESSIDPTLLDRKPFVVKHGLIGHDSLTLPTLSRVVTELPADQVFYSSGLVERNADFDNAHIDHRTGLTLEETMESIRTSNSYVMVRGPEEHPAFRELFRELKTAVEELMRVRGVGNEALDPMLYLFIASPGSVTPFHIDRYSTFLFQFQGKKDIYVYPAFDERLVPAETAESFVVWAGGRPTYKQELDHLGTKFSFAPGEALHIPFLAPHHVHNGPDEVSVSLSIIFNTAETRDLLAALRLNHNLRKVFSKLGMKPQPVGSHRLVDKAKALAQQVIKTVRGH
jgi:hypothetical protein